MIKLPIKLPEGLDKNKKRVIILIALAALFMVIVYFNFVLKPHITGCVSTVIKMNKLHSDLKHAEADIRNIGKYKSNLDAYREKVERYEKMLPAEQEVPNLLGSLSGMAKSSSVKIVGITPAVTKQAQKGQIYQEIPILISAKSGYHELGRFLDNLENSDRFMKVADIAIKSNPATPRKHDVELLILTYVLKR